MKIFAFDPATGTKGEHIGNAPVCSYANMGIDFAVKQGFMSELAYKKPRNSVNIEWTAHTDAGYSGSNGKDVSLLKDEWICFCLGEFHGIDPGGVWQWVILPPKDVLEFHKL